MTLVEMLVVLAIMGVVSAAAVLGLGGLGRTGGAEAEARLLGQHLQLAADEAMVTDRPIALHWDARGYDFVDEVGGTAKPDSLPDLGARRGLRSGVSLAIDDAGGLIPITADGTGHPVEATLDDGKTSWTVRFDGIEVAVARADGA